MTRPRTHSTEELDSPGKEGLQGLRLCHSHRPMFTRGRKTSLAGCPPFGHRHQPGPEVTLVSDALGWGSVFPALQGPQLSILSSPFCLSAEVKLLGLEGSEKLSILRGCPGLPGATGPKGEAGTPGGRGMCRVRVGPLSSCPVRPISELGSGPAVSAGKLGSCPAQSQRPPGV